MKRPVTALLLGSFLVTSCATTAVPSTVIVANGSLIRADGQQAGRTELLREGDRLYLRLTGSGFDAGTRALHLHQQGKCDRPDFTSAGGHLNPFGKTHGKLSEMGQHLGDLPNLEIPATGSFEMTVELYGSASKTLPQILDAEGTAVMIHAGPDDYKTDPSGAAGPRIACAVLSPTS
jgi:Cu-Zn family superoxide dismutase